MNHRPDLIPDDESLLIDAIQGELAPAERQALEARVAQDPALARAHERWQALARAERTAFEPEGPGVRAEAVRVAAWVRQTARRDEAASRARPRRPARVKGWTRVLACSVAAHVVLLGVLAIILRTESTPGKRGGSSVTLVDSGFDADGMDDGVGFDRNIASYESLVHRDLGDRFDELAMIEQEDLAELPDDLEQFLREQPLAWGERTHPVGVVVPMTRRRVESLKRRRLRLLGYNEEGTLAAVDKGLGFLGNRQDNDGSFPTRTGSSRVGETALVMLAFLGEGHSSKGHRERDAIVRHGVRFLRKGIFPNGVAGADAGVKDAAALAPVTIALSEDYMLGYGALTLAEADQRTAEIGALARQVRAALDGPRGSSASQPEGTRTWLLWALDATARAGVIQQTDAERAAFRNWVATTAAAQTGAQAGSAEQALIAGTALLYTERGAVKPRFTSWSKANAEHLVDRLGPRGDARGPDPIADTARVLLALQVAYRTY